MSKLALTYDDIQLVPAFSSVKSRLGIQLYTKLSRRYNLLVPLVASPMDTVCEEEMAFKMFLSGGVGCIHRFLSIDEQSKQVRNIYNKIYGDGLYSPYLDWVSNSPENRTGFDLAPIMAAIGVMENDRTRAQSLDEAGANVLLIDVAHGDHQNVVDMIKWCKDNLDENVDIIAGNIATAEAAERLQEAGADGLRVGIGGGSLCTTRIKTGFGVPNVTSLLNVCSVAKVPVMADGGLRSSGDIAKALAVGANNVMLGSLLAGTAETPGGVIDKNGSLYKRYRGSASLETKTAHGQQQRNVEGESTVIPFKGGVKFIVQGLLDGVRSALSYAGADSLESYSPQWVQVTNSGLKEGQPHLL